MTSLAQSLAAARSANRARIIVNGVLIAAAVLVAVGLADSIALVLRGEHEVVDFRPYYFGAEALLRGETLYPALSDTMLGSGRAYVYPPLTAIAAAPLSVLPVSVAEATVVLLGVGAVIGSLSAVGVRDWRCYVVVFCWSPVLSAVLLGNLTVFLGLAAALAWRFRNHYLRAGMSLGVAIAAKFLLWPLLMWLVATRRVHAALYATAVGAIVFAASWALVGFEGMAEYPELLRRLQGEVETGSYTVYVVALEGGAPAWSARGVWLALGIVLLSLFVFVDRRGADRAAFVIAIAASLALSPVVWLHYFELLAVAVAVARPRLGIVWFVPLLMWLVATTDSGNGTTYQTAATVVVVAATVVLAVRSSLEPTTEWSGPERRRAPSPWWHERVGDLVRRRVVGS